MNRRYQVAIHALFWISHMVFIYTTYGNYTLWVKEKQLIIHDIDFFSGYIIRALLFYTNYLFILPAYIKNRKLGQLIFLEFAALFADSALMLLHDKIFSTYYHSVFDLKDGFFWAFITSILFLFVSTGIKFAETWYKSENATKVLAGEKLSAEIAFLKSQINPHFLFNTLNNVYSLALTNSPKTTVAITRLKEIMQYMDRDNEQSKTPMQQEIAYLENYIELEKLRLSKLFSIKFEITGDFKDTSVEPLLFIPFVENAFKHGNINSPEAFIHIALSKEKNTLTFSVRNYYKAKQKDPNSGIGLSNVRRRLELLYRNEYTLTIDMKNNVFSIELILIIS